MKRRLLLRCVLASLLVSVTFGSSEKPSNAPHSAEAEAHAAVEFSTDKGGHSAAPAAKTETPAPAPASHPPPQETHSAKPPAATPTETQAKQSPADREAASLLELGARLTERSDFRSAEVSFRQVIERAEFNIEDKKSALIGIARLYRKQGLPSKSSAIYEKFLKEFPDDPRRPALLLDLGRTLRQMGAHNLALSRFYAVINSTLKVPAGGFEEYQRLAKTAQFEIAETHFDSGNYAEAGKFFSRLRLLDLAPVDRARAHFKAGYSLYLAQDNEKAVRVLRDFIESWPEDENAAEARYLLASTFWAMNRRDDALTVTFDLFRAEQAKAGENAKRWAYWQRRTGNHLANEFFQIGETRAALQIYLGLANLSPELNWRLPSLYQAALCQERLQSPEEAITLYRQICDEVPPNSTVVELTELVRMSKWRIEHLSWGVDTTRKITNLFATVPPLPPAETPPSPPKENDSRTSPPAAPTGL